jgi:hypothetical protein
VSTRTLAPQASARRTPAGFSHGFRDMNLPPILSLRGRSAERDARATDREVGEE